MTCEYCDLESGKQVIFEDDEVVVAVKDTGVIPGQITVFPREHFTILEMVPDKIVKKCSIISNKVSVAIFETLGAQGTNIIIHNGLAAGQKVAHFAMEIIPRQEADGLNLMWEPKQFMEDEMEATFMQLKPEGEKLVDIGKEGKKDGKKVKTAKGVEIVDNKDNYMLKQLKRRP
jgi:diadenosine tetraphosphate (Ap4A) HIT family hydrolase